MIKNENIKEAIAKCSDQLEKILSLSNAIAEASRLDEFDKVEPLFSQRGMFLNNLLELEKSLETDIQNKSIGKEDQIVDDYILKRKTLFEEIDRIDKEIKAELLSHKQDIMTEMKGLYRGKKMQSGYLSIPFTKNGFIDLKE